MRRLSRLCDGFLRAIEKGVDSLELHNSNFQCRAHDLQRYNQILRDKASQLAAIESAARREQEEALAKKRAEAIERNRREEAEARKPVSRLTTAYTRTSRSATSFARDTWSFTSTMWNLSEPR
jgi:peptidoglycan hydrolase CwlO-like protein